MTRSRVGRRRSRTTTPSTTRVGTDADARGPKLLLIEPATGEPVGAPEDTVARLWRVRQTLDDPEGHHDWVIDAVVDLDASDEAGELVLATVAMHRLWATVGSPGHRPGP